MAGPERDEITCLASSTVDPLWPEQRTVWAAHSGGQSEVCLLPGKGGNRWGAGLERQLLGGFPCLARPDKPLPTASVPGPSSLQETLAQTSVVLGFYV